MRNAIHHYHLNPSNMLSTICIFLLRACDSYQFPHFLFRVQIIIVKTHQLGAKKSKRHPRQKRKKWQTHTGAKSSEKRRPMQKRKNIRGRRSRIIRQRNHSYESSTYKSVKSEYNNNNKAVQGTTHGTDARIQYLKSITSRK